MRIVSMAAVFVIAMSASSTAEEPARGERSPERLSLSTVVECGGTGTQQHQKDSVKRPDGYDFVSYGVEVLNANPNNPDQHDTYGWSRSDGVERDGRGDHTNEMWVEASCKPGKGHWLTLKLTAEFQRR